MKTLLLIPGVTEADPAEPRPRRDYEALAAALDDAGGGADLLDFAAAARDPSPAVRLAGRWGGPSAALAMLGFQRRRRYDAILSLDERVGVPLALLMNAARSRPGHVCCARQLSGAAQRLSWTLLRAHGGLDTVLVQAQGQRDFAEDRLGFLTEKLSLVVPPLDEHFYRPSPGAIVPEEQIGAAGRQGRDYETLAQALESLPDLAVELAVSPHDQSVLPGRATVRPDTPAGRRALYARSLFVAVPLRDSDAPTGTGAILEAMAMGKAVVATRTHGQAEVVIEGVTGLSVAPGDVAGWRRAVARLRGDAALRGRLGHNARRWVEENATLERWAEIVRQALRDAAAGEAGTRFSGAPATSLPIFR